MKSDLTLVSLGDVGSRSQERSHASLLAAAAASAASSRGADGAHHAKSTGHGCGECGEFQQLGVTWICEMLVMLGEYGWLVGKVNGLRS
jgi:hypothetical protein